MRFSSSGKASVLAVTLLLTTAGVIPIRAQQHENIREVVAVPPFASTNLAYDHEYLKSAYAKLVEQAALANRGVLIVELAEAEAIAREINLTDPGKTLKRSAPLYLLGEFRHQGNGITPKELQVTLKLQATRGGQPVGEPITKTVSPADAPAALHQWIGDRLAAEKSKPAPAFEPKVETKHLAELYRSRQRVADWADALALLEASLLLDPNQPELNADALALIKIRTEQMGTSMKFLSFSACRCGN